MIKLFIGQEEIIFKSFVFNAGEVQVQLPPTMPNPWQECRIEAKIHSSNDIMILFNLTNACRMLWGHDVNIGLIMPYVPYSRQDRVCSEGEAFSLKTFCDMVNLQNYSYIEIYDPHSDVAPALLNNCYVKEQWEFLKDIDNSYLYNHALDKEATILVSPDAGANKKTVKVAQKCGFNKIVRADKLRDVETGSITNTIVYSDHVGDKDFFIVDDICDNGGTFIALAKELKKLTTGSIYLYTTHAILGKGFGPLYNAGIKHMFTVNPWASSVNEDLITILKEK